MEYKYDKLNLSALQEQWLKDRYNEGRNVAVVLGFPGGGVIFRNLEWSKKGNFPGKAISRKEIARWIASEVGSKCNAQHTKSGPVRRSRV